MSGLLPTARAPLLERLCAGADAPVDSAMLDAHGLQASIARELGRLLNTRTHLTFDAFGASGGSVIDYGLPDHSALSPRSSSDLERLRLAITQAVARFEPRLVDTRVTVGDCPGQPARARITLDAHIRLGLEMRRVQFTLEADPASIRTGTPAAATGEL